MRLATQTTRKPRVQHALLRDRIVEIVTDVGGIKESDLLMTVMNDLHDEDDLADISPEGILTVVQLLVNEGRIIAIDCQIGDTGCTFLLPAGTQIRTVVPIERLTTRH